MKTKCTIAAPILVTVVLLLLCAVDYLPPERLAGVGNPYLVLAILSLLIYAVPSLFFCRLRGADFVKRLRIRLFSPNHLFLILLALVVMTAASGLLNLWMYRIFPSAFAAEGNGTAGGEPLLYLLLTVCILPGVLEEFLFHSIITAEYESLSVPTAVVMSALLFAMLHLNFARFPAYFVCGIILGLVLYATRSVLAAMTVHILNNTAALWIDHYIRRAAGTAGERSTLLVFILMCVLMIGLILFFLEAQRIYAGYAAEGVRSEYRRKSPKNQPSGAWQAYVSPTFMLTVVLFVVLSLLKL